MLTRRLQTLFGLVLCALGAGWAAAACDLNPQPLPPGETPADAGGFTAPTEGADASLTTGGGSGGDNDSGSVNVPPGSGDADAAAPAADGGSAKDGGGLDGASDAEGDATSDGQSDAPSDANEDGG